jgi:hypothetical protein
MSNQFIDYTAPSLQGPLPKRPEDLPHGLVVPPDRVRELVVKEKAKFSAEVFTPEAEERILNEWSLQYYFDYLGYEVLYRQTPEGPEVLAVGFDEIFARTQGMNPKAFEGLKTWVPG